jgi:23S rRNA (adenine2030-N6)-methyltransferase
MLSYRHAFHAGNFADVLKHSVLSLILEYMTRKEKGYTYIDSHSGAGIYSLTDDYAQKTGEYRQGIAKLIDNSDLPEVLLPYIELIKALNTEDKLSLYPGSPSVAKHFSRRQDSAHLFELHSTDIEHLKQFCLRWNKSFVSQSDGYQGLLGLLPPPSRRGLILIDPPYELKEDYTKAVSTIIKAYKKFATGTYVLWYPVVTRAYIDNMIANFSQSSVTNLLRVEFCQQPDSDAYGMTGTGLFIVNPPWQLAKQLANLLPYLQMHLGQEGSQLVIEQLIAE